MYGKLWSLDVENLSVAKVFSLTWGRLLSGEVDVVAVVDQEEATDRMLAMGKPSVTPVLSARRLVFPRTGSITLFLQRDGRDVAGAMARFDDLGEEDVGLFFARLMEMQYAEQGAPKVRSRRGPLSRDVAGRVVYMGDLFVRPGERGSLALLENLVTLLQITCHWQWPGYDWMCAFLREKDAGRGAVERYNFTRSEFMTNIWDSPPEGRSSNERLVALSREDFFAKMDGLLLQSTGVE